MFNKKEKQRIKELEVELRKEKKINEFLNERFEKMLKDDERKMAALMRESLGIEIDFSDQGPDGKPKNYLFGLNKDERTQFLIDGEAVFQNRAYKEVVRYMINLFGFHALYKEDKEQMKNGQVATVAFAAFRKQFDDLHKEFLLLGKKEEEFDPLEPLPQ